MSLLSFSRLLKSFKYAASGLIYALREEQNLRIHLIAAIFVAVLGYVFKVSKLEAIVLIFAIASVFTAELINSIFERIVDILKPRLHPYAEKVKDMMAAVVLVAAIASFAIGFIVFLPKIIFFFRGI